MTTTPMVANICSNGVLVVLCIVAGGLQYACRQRQNDVGPNYREAINYYGISIQVARGIGGKNAVCCAPGHREYVREGGRHSIRMDGFTLLVDGKPYGVCEPGDIVRIDVGPRVSINGEARDPVGIGSGVETTNDQ